MCAPALMVASLLLSAATTAVSYQEGKESAQRQQDAIDDASAKERAATQRQYQQIQESSMDEQAQRHTEYLIDSARLRAIGGESGLQGATQDRIEMEAENNASSDMATLESNRRNASENASSQALGRATQANIQSAGIRRPSSLGAGLQIAGAGVKTYSKYKEGSETK